MKTNKELFPTPISSNKYPNYIKPEIPRNADCPCGSGKKYKKCCLKELNNEIFKDDFSKGGGGASI